MKNILALILLSWLIATSLQGQQTDPVEESYWKKVELTLQQANISPAEQLNTLLEFEKKINGRYSGHESLYLTFLQRISKLYSNREDYAHAIQYSRQAIKLLTTYAGNPSTEPAQLIKEYYWLAYYYNLLNQPYERMQALDNCIAAGQNREEGIEYYLHALFIRAKYLFGIGDYNRSSDYAYRGIKLSTQYSKYYEDYYSSFLNYYMNAQLQLKNYDAAEKALNDVCNIGGDFAGNIYQQLAIIEINRGNINKALNYYNKALQAHRQIKYDMGCMQALLNLGYHLYYLQLKDGRKALLNYRKALQYVKPKTQRSLEESIEVLNLMANIANVFVQFNQYDSAFHYFDQAFDQLGPGINENNLPTVSLDSIIEYNRLFYLTALFIDKGDAFLKQYKTNKTPAAAEQAIHIYRLADQLLDRIKTEQSEMASRLFWRTDSRRLYEHAIEAAYYSNDKTNAFYFFEKSRAVLLNDQVKEQHLLAKDDILKQAQLKRKLLQLKRERNTLPPASGRFTEVEKEIFSYTQQLDQVGQLIKTNHPLYFQSFFDTAFITLNDVHKNLLNDHHALVEIYNGDSAVYSLIITPQQTRLWRINKPAFDSIARRYMTYLSSKTFLNKDFNGYLQTAHQLYKLVFQDKEVPEGRIIISPDGHYFPFESLVTSLSASPVYFLQNHIVSYTYSARYLLNNFTANTTTTNSFIGVAPVTYHAGLSLPALPGSDGSLNRISNYFNNANNLLLSNASRKNFLQNFSTYSIIQLYTHASGSNNANSEPVIYFADSAMYLSDLIAESKPSTRLVVLSACETGTGAYYSGEGVFSFNRGFASLGIPSSVINLWAVNNKTTYQITELFYKHLSKGLPADVALQKAKTEFLQTASKEYTLPYYWAAPILSGKTNALEKTRSTAWKWYLPALVLFCIGVYGWVRKRNKQ